MAAAGASACATRTARRCSWRRGYRSFHTHRTLTTQLTTAPTTVARIAASPLSGAMSTDNVPADTAPLSTIAIFVINRGLGWRLSESAWDAVGSGLLCCPEFLACVLMVFSLLKLRC